MQIVFMLKEYIGNSSQISLQTHVLGMKPIMEIILTLIKKDEEEISKKFSLHPIKVNLIYI